MLRLRWLVVLCWWLASALVALGQDPAMAKYAVVRIPSHGCSATVIATDRDRTLILGCAHAYQGTDRVKRMTIDAPVSWQPSAGGKAVSIRLLAVDYKSDLSLVELGAGPMPYVAPVAPAGHRPGGRILAVGYDEMQMPPQMRPTTLLGNDGRFWWTKERPWHGRSGGGLLDMDTGYLIGVCHGYTGPSDRQEVSPGGKGMYVSHQAVLAFLSRPPSQPPALDRAPPWQQQPLPQQQQWVPQPIPILPPHHADLSLSARGCLGGP